MQVIKAPESLPYGSPEYTVFFAGSIEMGVAENWQDKLTRLLAQHDGIILNPRRDDWDSSWKQDISDPQFNKQVNWELDAQSMADRIVMYFDASTKSPITLLELGLFADSRKLVVCCTEGFWRKGNVDIVCQRYNIQQVDSLERLFDVIETDLQMDTFLSNLHAATALELDPE